MRQRTWILHFTVFLWCCHNAISITSYSHGRRCSKSPTATIPHPSDCSTFLRCAGGRWRDYKCPAGGVFNAVSGFCAWPQSYSGCKVPTTNTNKMKVVTGGCVLPCPEDGRMYLYPHLQTCDDFYMCKAGVLYRGACSDIHPAGTYNYFNSFMFSCDRIMEIDNACRRWTSK